jgi:pilus assembly protein Flp/PilA
MRHFTSELRRFMSAREGTTVIEYGVIATGIAVAIIAAVTALGGSVKSMWTVVASALG